MESYVGMIAGSVLLIISMIGLIYSLNYQKERKEKGIINIVKDVDFFYGLSIPEGTKLDIVEYNDKLIFEKNNIKVELMKEKIVDITIKKDIEIQKQYVSSVGKAIGGAIMFGTLGAIIGGRTKTKKTYDIDYYFIITYLKENQPEYISFICNGKVYDVRRIENSFKKSSKTTNIKIEL